MARKHRPVHPVRLRLTRLARYFGTTEQFWLNLQARHDLEVQRDELGPRLKKEVRVLQRAS